MKKEIQEILDAFSSNQFDLADSLCKEAIKSYQIDFMESLTVNTATDYIGIVILYCQVCGQMKKPWKAIPALEAVEGALRFINDFMKDRETVASTYFNVAESYAYAGFLPEAILYFRLAGGITEDSSMLNSAYYSAFYYSYLFGEEDRSELSDSAKKVMDMASLNKLMHFAEKEAEAQILTDPIEREDVFLSIRYEIERAVDEVIVNDHGDEGYCLKYWRIKKQLLKERFNIDWKTPAEMNPEIQFK